jgi:hypothetical protein
MEIEPQGRTSYVPFSAAPTGVYIAAVVRGSSRNHRHGVSQIRFGCSTRSFRGFSRSCGKRTLSCGEIVPSRFLCSESYQQHASSGRSNRRGRQSSSAAEHEGRRLGYGGGDARDCRVWGSWPRCTCAGLKDS